MDDRVAPVDDSWVVSLHGSAESGTPLGAGVCIDTNRVLASRHVVADKTPAALWVAFPKADPATLARRGVTQIVRPEGDVFDVVVLRLDGDVPSGVRAAPLRCPRPKTMVTQRWWAFGFPDEDPVGNEAYGHVAADLGYGWVRLDTQSPYLVERGFSGAAIWCPGYDQSVVGLVGHANVRGDARALSLDQVDLALPGENLRQLADWHASDAGPVALAQWGWSLSQDPEGPRHWLPRGRGVAVDAEAGYRFRGRRTALTEIGAWLDRESVDSRVLVVTGSPGVGKSAVLGRVVSTADPALRALLPVDDHGARATVGSVAVAVHAKGKSALEVATEIAVGASAGLPDRVEDLPAALREVLADRRRRFNVVVDALDEATSPVEARRVITNVILPLAETCADLNLQVVTGTRRQDPAGDLLAPLVPRSQIIDLDAPAYFELDDLAAYAEACLTLVGAERPDNPYRPGAATTRQVAQRIAELADKNFLVAGLIGREHGLNDSEPVDPARLQINATVRSALDGYLERIPPAGVVAGRNALTTLAYAEAPGFTAELWALAVRALYGEGANESSLRDFARSPAGDFLIEDSVLVDGHTLRLFHQALNESLLADRHRSHPAQVDEAVISRTLYTTGKSLGWPNAPQYLLRALAGHAQRAGTIDQLLEDDEFLLHADLLRLTPVAATAQSDAGRQRARLLRLAPEAARATPGERAALFSLTNAIDDLRIPFTRPPPGTPYRARWASTTPRSELTAFEGHAGWVRAVCSLRSRGAQLLASAGFDGTIRLWDLTTGQPHGPALSGHNGWINALCPLEIDGQTLLASAGFDGKIRLWDPATGKPYGWPLAAFPGEINALCLVRLDPATDLLAAAGADGTVRMWNLRTGQPHGQPLTGHDGWINALCTVDVHGTTLVASAGRDGTVRLWDPATGEGHEPVLRGWSKGVRALCAFPGEVNLLAFAGDNGTVRLWNPATGRQHGPEVKAVGQVNAMVAIQVRERWHVASAGVDGTVRVWDPVTGRLRGATFSGHTDEVNAVCRVGSEGLLASAGDDGTVRLWHPDTPSTPERSAKSQANRIEDLAVLQIGDRRLLASARFDGTVQVWDPTVRGAAIRAEPVKPRGGRLCAVQAGDEQLLACAGGRTVDLWALRGGASRQAQTLETGATYALCAVQVVDRQLLATAGLDKIVKLWDPVTGRLVHRLQGHSRRINALCTVDVGTYQLLASGDYDGRILRWSPTDSRRHFGAAGRNHDGEIRALCAVPVGGYEAIASGGTDRVVRLWNPANGDPLGPDLVGHTSRVTALCAVRSGTTWLLASASDDRTVRIWDVAAGACLWVLPLRGKVNALASIDNGLAIGATNGLVFVELG